MTRDVSSIPVSTSSTNDVASAGTGARPCDGVFPQHWIDGRDCSEPSIMVHAYDPDTYILRQSLCTNFEGPFMYLLFGRERVLLEDTGAGGIAIADTVDEIIATWLADHGLPSIELVVVNSHAHGDHVAGNAQFEERPNTVVVPPSVAGLSTAFGITAWPDQTVEIDLGSRVVDLVPIPGHQASHIALFDRNAGLLLTGDTLYPGRLYIADFPAYLASLHRLMDAIPEHEVCHVLGTHIEMTQTPGADFEFGSTEHPNEHALPLTWGHLTELRDAVDAMATPTREIHDDFIVYPL